MIEDIGEKSYSRFGDPGSGEGAMVNTVDAEVTTEPQVPRMSELTPKEMGDHLRVVGTYLVQNEPSEKSLQRLPEGLRQLTRASRRSGDRAVNEQLSYLMVTSVKGNRDMVLDYSAGIGTLNSLLEDRQDSLQASQAALVTLSGRTLNKLAQDSLGDKARLIRIPELIQVKAAQVHPDLGPQ